MKKLSIDVKKALAILGWVILVYAGMLIWVGIGFLFHGKGRVLWFSLVWPSIMTGVIICLCVGWWNSKRKKRRWAAPIERN